MPVLHLLLFCSCGWSLRTAVLSDQPPISRATSHANLSVPLEQFQGRGTVLLENPRPSPPPTLDPDRANRTNLIPDLHDCPWEGGGSSHTGAWNSEQSVCFILGSSSEHVGFRLSTSDKQAQEHLLLTSTVGIKEYHPELRTMQATLWGKMRQSRAGWPLGVWVLWFSLLYPSSQHNRVLFLSGRLAFPES